MEEHSPEGIGSYAAIINSVDEELSERMKNFLEGIGYVGFSNFDMKYDPRDGQYKLFEMNLRQGRSSFFVTAAGYNLAKFLVDDVIYNKPMDCVIADNKVLWTIIPKKIIFQYVKDPKVKEEAKRLIKEKKFCPFPLLCTGPEHETENLFREKSDELLPKIPQIFRQ